MAFYHATYADRIPSILQHGLGGVVPVRNFPEAWRGVYLSSDPILALGFLIEHSLGSSDSPREALDTFRVIVIDDSRIDRKKLIPDPQVNAHRGVFHLYLGTIDVAGMPIITVQELNDAPIPLPT